MLALNCYQKIISLPKPLRLVFSSRFRYLYVKGFFFSFAFVLPRFTYAVFAGSSLLIFMPRLAVKFSYAYCSYYIAQMFNALRGFMVELHVRGVGYKACQTKNDAYLAFRVGYSHVLILEQPHYISIRLISAKKTRLLWSYFSKQKLLEQAFLIKTLKVPDPYKGKGLAFFFDKLQHRDIKKPG